MRAPSGAAVCRTAALALMFALTLSLCASPLLHAQRRPGVDMGFFTYTGLLSADAEIGSVTSSTAMAQVPTVALSALVTAPVIRAAKRAWIVGVRATALGVGNGDSCYITPGTNGCQNRRASERVVVLTGGAFDIRSTVLRAMVGPALYSVQGEGTRLGPSVRLDYGSPREQGATPTLFFTRTFLGSQRGEMLAVSTLGASFRWVRKR